MSVFHRTSTIARVRCSVPQVEWQCCGSCQESRQMHVGVAPLNHIAHDGREFPHSSAADRGRAGGCQLTTPAPADAGRPRCRRRRYPGPSRRPRTRRPGQWLASRYRSGTAKPVPCAHLRRSAPGERGARPSERQTWQSVRMSATGWCWACRHMRTARRGGGGASRALTARTPGLQRHRGLPVKPRAGHASRRPLEASGSPCTMKRRLGACQSPTAIEEARRCPHALKASATSATSAFTGIHWPNIFTARAPSSSLRPRVPAAWKPEKSKGVAVIWCEGAM